MAYTTIKKPSDYFNTKLYTGNASTQSITGLDFAPDFVWLKDRTNANSGRINDIVRTATKYLIPSTTGAEATEAAGLTSFNSDGFSLGSNSDFNGSGANFVSWNWLANGAGVANTDGSISSTVSANTTSGFSIVSYTGTGSNATIGHGLGAVPQVVLIKERNGTNNWLMSHQPLSASLGDYTRFITLNSNSAVSGAGNVVFQGSAFTSSYFNVGTSVGSNGSSQNFIAYCFAEKKGFSKFGSYTGNGNADGTFVYTGFKPAFVMTKRSNNTENWYMLDNERSPFNPPLNALAANLSNAEDTNATGRIQDFLSNGFKLRTSDTAVNGSGDTYIYMAFADEPLVGDNPATAR
jgi:hypothetical protein